MTNAAKTQAFLNVTDSKTKEEVLAAIATHYGISKAEALAEITHDEAESLLDYLTGNTRAAVHVLMKRHGLA